MLCSGSRLADVSMTPVKTDSGIEPEAWKVALTWRTGVSGPSRPAATAAYQMTRTSPRSAAMLCIPSSLLINGARSSRAVA